MLVAVVVALGVGLASTAQTANFTSNTTQGCVPLGGVNFTDASTGGVVINRDWNLGNGTIIPNGGATVGTNYLTSGTFIVTLTVTFANGDVRTATRNIVVHPKPVANFVASDTAGCRPHAVSFTDLSTTATGTITSWQWDFGAGGSTNANPNFVYTNVGQYNVSLIVTNSWGCQSDAATKFQYIKVYPRPNASFTATPNFGCKDTLTVNFNNTTTGGSPGNTYLWNFGDGNTSTVKNPTHFYAAPGTYTVTLTAFVGNNCSNTTTRTVTVSNFTAAFNTAPDTVCINVANTFSGSATPAAASIRWIFSDNGAIQFGASTSHTFATLGDYLVTMIATSPQGCLDTITKMVHVKSGANLAPFFVVAPDTVCLNAPNTFTGNSTPPPAAIRWIFSDNGAIQNGFTVSHSFGVLGDYQVTMIVYSPQGCTDTITKMVHVKNRANLSPIITVAPDTVCVNASTVFEGTAAIPPNLIRWQFSDNGAITTGSPTAHSFAPPGNYQVSLYVYDAQGCADTLTKPIFVKPGPVASFVPDKTSGCGIPFTVNFTNTSPGSDLQFTWNFGDGSPAVVTNGPLPISHTYNAFGNFTVTLTARDTLLNCPGPSATVLIRNVLPSINFTYVPPSGCMPLPVAFTAQITNLIVPVTYYIWNYGDGSPLDTTTSPISNHLYSTAGGFNASLTVVTSECTYTTITKPVTVIQICDDDGSGGGGGGGGGAGFTVGKTCADKYTVTLTDTVSNSIVISWDFGDGSPVYTTPPLNPVTHTYSPPQKVYIVTVIRQDTITGLFDTAQKRVIIIDEKANFAPNITELCVNGTVLFNTIGIDSSKINTYTWDFGDGTPRQIINNQAYFNSFGLYLNGNTSHIYADTGLFYVKLIITDRLGCLDSMLYPVPIRVNSPAAAFGAVVQISCLVPIRVTITDSSRRNGSIPITNWQWNFGDGSPVYNTTQDTVINRPYNLGTYTIRLTITDSTGCVSTTTRTIVVALDTAGPKAAFGATVLQNCLVPTKVVFRDSTRLNVGIRITNWQWNFGDGSPLYNTNVDTAITHFYNAGTYTVRLTVTDSVGCVSTTTRPVVIPIDTSGPRARFVATPITTCTSPQLVLFTDTSRLAAGNVPIVERRWTFGDGTPIQSVATDTVSHTYNVIAPASFYNVTLFIRDSLGCTATVTKPSYIKLYKPRADFFSNDTLKCGSYNVTFFNTSSAFNATYTWYYGDGTSSTGFNGSHTYATEGDYSVKLVVRDENGCMDSIVKSSYIKLVKPVADFIVGDTSRCAPTAIIFTDNSLYASSWLWDFGDGGTGSTDQNPSPHIYPLPGFYKITLYVVGLNGCTDSTFKWIRVRGPIANLQIPPAAGCKPLTFTGQVQGTFISTYAWDFGDGTPVNASLTDSIVTHTYNRGGKYLPNVVLVSPEGCPLTLKAADSVIVDTAKALFAPLANEFCATGTVSFTNLSQTTYFSSFTNYAWNFGDGSPIDPSATPAPHVFGPGNYTVSLAVTTQYGCVDTFTKPLAVVVHPLPVPQILGDSIRCAPGTYEYTSSISSVDPIQSYAWYVNGVAAGNSSNLNYAFVAGNYNIKLVVTTVNGCTDSTNRNIIVDFVKAFFTVLNPVNCANNLSVQIVNGSGGQFGISSYAWDFGDGTTSTLQNPPTHIYPGYGNYDVSLLVTSVHGCRDSMRLTSGVIIHPLPTAQILGDSIRCQPGTYTYTSSISSIDPIQTFTWYVDGVAVSSDSNLVHNFVAGNHIIKLKVETINGCLDSTSRNIIVDSVDAAFNVVNPVRCANNLSVQFNNTSGSQFGISSYAWDFGDGTTSTLQNPSPHLYPSYGNYNVSLLVVSVHGCRDSVTIAPAVVLHPLPSAQILGDSIRCQPGTYSYTSSISSIDRIQTFTWYVDGVAVSSDSNLVHNFFAGNHIIKLKVQTINGCLDSTSRNIIVDSVDAAFNVVNPVRCANNLSVQFNNTSGSQFGISSYAWDFGDGTTSTLQNPPPHLYPSYGNYNVSLLVVSVHGCRDSVTIAPAVVLHPLPTAQILGDSLHCKPGTYTYTSSISSIDPIQTYAWYVNGALVGSDSNLNHAFVAGNYTIKLVVTTVNGCTDSTNRNIIVDFVKAFFTVLNPVNCANNLSVQIANGSGGQFGISSYAWDFGDGTTSTLQNPPPHLYPGYGNYNISLLVVSVHGCRDSMRLSPGVIIHPLPSAQILGDSIHCTPGIYTYTSNISTIDRIQTFTWYVDGVAVSSDSNLIRNFMAGNHIVKLKVQSINGCLDSTSRNIIVDSVDAAFNVVNPVRCANNLSVQFNNTSGSQFGISSYAWDLGDGTTSTLQNPSPHVYPGFGVYNVSLLVVSVHGCRDSVRIDSAVIINRQPTVGISGDSIHCTPGTYQYLSVSNTLDGVNQWRWKVNGVTVSNASNLTYNFRAGNYRIDLWVSTPFGCVDSVSRNIIIDSVNAAFTVNRPIRCGNNDLTVNFTNQSGGQFFISNYLWALGDGQTSTLITPSHTYPTVGSYAVDLIAYSEHGCSDTVRIAPAVTIYATPTVTVSGDTAICANNSLSFASTVASQDSITSYQWRVNGVAVGNGTSLIHFFGTAGTYAVTLQITTAHGCAVTDTHTVVIHRLPIPNASPNTTICIGSSLILRAYDGVTYEWTPAATLQNPNTDQPQATPTQTTQYKVKVTNQFGCVQYDSITIRVDNKINLQMGPDRIICQGETTTISASGTAAQYSWSPTTGLGSPNSAVSTASPTTTTQYTVTATSGNTCPTETGVVNVTVGVIPTVDLGPDKVVPAGTAITLQPSTTGGVTNYIWSPSLGLSCITCPQTNFTADKDVTYRVEVRTQYGCRAMDEINIVVTCNKGAVYVPNAFTPNNDGKNDRFYITGYGLAKIRNLSVYDRWGRLMYQVQNSLVTDRTKGWDGTFKGQPVEQGAYVYIAEVECTSGETTQLKGSLILIR